MASKNATPDEKPVENEEEELPVPWQQVQSALWLIGLAILFWQGWFWPGILILAGISGLFQAAVQLYLKRQEAQQVETTQAAQLEEARRAWLPPVCPTCGAPINVSNVQWTGPNTAACPFCSAHLKEGM